FISVLGQLQVTAGSSVFLQSTMDDLSINNVQAGGEVSITAPGSILSSGNSTRQITTTGDLRLLAGSGNLAATSSPLTPLVIDIDGVLTSASAGGKLSLKQLNGNLSFDRVFAG